MKALITGASSGIGRDIARVLHARGYDLIITARRADRLAELQEELGKNRVRVILVDLSKEQECFDLFDKVKDEDIEILVNNAGFGLYGAFDKTDLSRELEMIDLNIRAAHILTKLFLQVFQAKNRGYILNVASSAGFLPGPMMSSYYASKAYVLRQVQAIREELLQKGSRVYIGALCPGPVETEFNQVAGASFAVKGLDCRYVAEYAVRQMFKGKAVIVPGRLMKAARFLVKCIPDSMAARAAYHIQRRRKG